MDPNFYYKFVEPDQSIADFVENIGMFHNQSDTAKEVVLMPDGRVDLFFMQTPTKPFEVALIGLETVPDQINIPPQTLAFKISFKPLAVEYILQTSIADFLNSAKNLPNDFWNFNAADLKDFDSFYHSASQKIKALLPAVIDEKKRKLFELIYASKGEMKVHELSEKVCWSSRQMNRYFNQQFGISLKAFCKILRFRESLGHIAQGKLFPELNFTDQTHFIKEVKKFSGVVPKELFENKNDRFILLSVMQQK
jgi:AraC-like DNA-binding protein